MRDLIRQKIADSLAAKPTRFTPRDIHVPAVKGKAIAVIGMRRTGKTTFLWQLLADRLACGARREALLYFNFEDERLAGIKANELHWVLEEYFTLHPELRDRQGTVFFFDEIQSVDGWEGFTRRVLDSERVELFLSGSSARLLSREVATAMRGRAMEALVHPFSFREFLRHRDLEPTTKTMRAPKALRSNLTRQLREYLTGGGFPEAQGAQARDRFELLRGYVDTALIRDVIERHAVSHPIALRWMVRQLLGNAGSYFSVSKFLGDLKSQGIPVAKDTLHAYLAHLDDAFLIRTLYIASDSERRRMVNPRKIYPIDMGLIPVFDRSGKANLGHALETAVLLELERRGATTHYVRTADGHEVDFLARYPDGTSELIQVCADMDTPVARERETRSLLGASPDHPGASLNIISLQSSSPRGLPPGIRYHDAVDWLLASS